MNRSAMDLYPLQEDVRKPASDLAMAMARHALRWLSPQARKRLGQTGCTVLETQVIALVQAHEAGHVCSRISGDPVANTLLESGLVGTPGCPASRPFILDDEGRFYLHRAFTEESRLAREVLRRSQAESLPVAKAAQTLLDEAFQANARRLQGRPDAQKQAVALALLRPLVWIHGGPGTGKTSTVVNLIACLLAQAPASRIALAAPTGKAAARLLEAVRERAQAFGPAIQAKLPAHAWTLHRLLGPRHKRSHELSMDADHATLAFDLVVVDEASMLDLSLAVRLFEAAGPQTRIVLLGDRNQLSAVEAGAVFAELAARVDFTPGCAASLAKLSAATPQTARSVGEGAPEPTLASEAVPQGSGCALPDTVIWLTERYRFAAGSPIDALASAVCEGDTEGALTLLDRARNTDGHDAGLSWIETTEGSGPDAQVLREALRGYAPFRDALEPPPQLRGEPERPCSDPVKVLAAFNRFRILCAVHEGAQGVKRLNLECEAALGRRTPRSETTGPPLWYPGRPVMVRRNDYRVGLFNGDVGIALADATGGVQLWFASEPDTFRRVSTAQIPEHVTAFALTVHAAQGSQFEETLVVLPERPGPVLTRELLYTALTRSTRRVILAGSSSIIEAAIRSPTRRHSGLAARIREAQQLARKTTGSGA